MHKLFQIKPRIFLLVFDEQYDLCMHFLRYSEYYESSEFKGKEFTIVDFIEFYTKKHGSFSYPQDWWGFNVTDVVLEEVRIPDRNKYDDAMSKIYKTCREECKEGKFSLIGITKDDDKTYCHELAHALYYTNKQYKFDMDVLAYTDMDHYRCFEEICENMGYHKSVAPDEMQAYCATGLIREQIQAFKRKKFPYTKICKPFKEVFQKYCNE